MKYAWKHFEKQHDIHSSPGFEMEQRFSNIEGLSVANGGTNYTIHLPAPMNQCEGDIWNDWMSLYYQQANIV